MGRKTGQGIDTSKRWETKKEKLVCCPQIFGVPRYSMKVGDAIHLPTGVPHLIRNTGKEVMRMACSFSSSDISRDLKNEEGMKF